MLGKMVSGCHLVATKTTKTSELRYPLPPTPPPPHFPLFWKLFKKLPIHSTPLCKSITLGENGIL